MVGWSYVVTPIFRCGLPRLHYFFNAPIVKGRVIPLGVAEWINASVGLITTISKPSTVIVFVRNHIDWQPGELVMCNNT